MRRLSMPIVLLLSVAGCGASVDREATLGRLQEAIHEEIPPHDQEVLEDHNELVVTVRDGNVLDGMRRFEVEEALGRGQECGSRPLCAEHEFEPDDWVYEVGRRDGLPWGPTIIVGFGRQGIVRAVYTLTRR